MLKIIEAPQDGANIGATRIVKSARLSSARSDAVRLSAAQQQAAAMLADATVEARRMREEGYRDGLQSATAAALQPLIMLLAKIEKMQTEFSLRVREQLSASVHGLIERGDVLESLLKAVFDAHDLGAGAELKITLPLAAAENARAIQAFCVSSGLCATVVVGSSDAFAVAWQGHRWETLIDTFADHAIEAAQPTNLSRENARVMSAAALADAATSLQGLAVSLLPGPKAEHVRYRQDGDTQFL